MRNGRIVPRTSLQLEDYVSSPVNTEATPSPSPLPIYETPTIKKEGKEYRVVDPLNTYGVDSNGS